jgi:hypothetical protein
VTIATNKNMETGEAEAITHVWKNCNVLTFIYTTLSLTERYTNSINRGFCTITKIL